MNKNFLPFLALFFIACSSSSDDVLPTETEEEAHLVEQKPYIFKDTNSKNIHVINLPGDIQKTIKAGHIPVYFSLEETKIINSFTTDGRLLELSEALKKSDKWDICFGGIYNSEITINSKLMPKSSGYNGVGLGMLYVTDTPYFKVIEAPSNAVFEAFAEDQTTVGWNDYPKGHLGWYFYSLNSHIMRSIKGRTIIIKTAKGKYAKIEMNTLYFNNPEKPTIHTPAPYFNFRFYLQNNGSRDLNSALI